ncbi:hypothetical protein COLO4_28915 [Corchorus olitorius]|uniref:HAT C-terminal dimerisation domain-containing protein n=1 Tax=Corchorus olitorius TaxID=93759 RepID=A0A1R3HHM5_9ROSI|nr:hypothetical protein COLO4_28915 [Corchorus olitorius]
MAARMFTKFEKYWSDFSIILAIACIVDPRYKEFDLEEALYEVDLKKSQLELYLEEKKEDRSRRRALDVINFWRVNQFRYPEVAAMARDILRILVSTVALESTFSVGAKVLDQYQNSLKPDVVEAIICSKD